MAGGNTPLSGGVWNAVDPALRNVMPTATGQLDTPKGYLDESDFGDFAPTRSTYPPAPSDVHTGFTAQIIQHEVDHFDGVLI